MWALSGARNNEGAIEHPFKEYNSVVEWIDEWKYVSYLRGKIDTWYQIPVQQERQIRINDWDYLSLFKASKERSSSLGGVSTKIFRYHLDPVGFT